MVKRSASSAHPDVMVSSTYPDLVEHRKAVFDALLRLGLFPVGMEFDSAKAGRDVIDSSLDMVGRAQAYVGVVSHRYGGVPKDAARNPQRLSITELEYREALRRGIPVYMFLMSDRHRVLPGEIETVGAYRKKLLALREDARRRSVYAEFSSVDELAARVLQSMAEFRARWERAAEAAEGGGRGEGGRGEPEVISPPELLAIPGFVSGHEFVGRRAELGWLDGWAASDEPLMVIEAIGGTGKSTLAWQWLKERAPAAGRDFDGVVWYSFYEGGADMADFAAHTLAYVTGRPLKEFRGRKTADLARPLVAALRERPFLLVLDGLERVLVAYHRLDAAQARDDQVASESDDRACIKPSDGDLLRQLVTAGPSKVLVTSRLMPAALTNRAGRALPGVRHRELGGLHPDDALTMMRRLGVRGDEAAVRRYLAENFDNHPLMLGVVAGLVNDYIREPGNFDRWADDPQGGAALDLSTLDLSQRRTHILAAALNGLEPGTRQLLSRIAALGAAVPFDTVSALNPFLPPPPPDPPDESLSEYWRHELALLEKALQSAPAKKRREELGRKIKRLRALIADAEARRAAHPRALEEYRASEEVREALPKLVAALRDLERRGLLQWDRMENSYDLHPVVRGYAFDVLEQAERTDICNLIVDYFQRKPPVRYADARTVADLQQSISIFRALVHAGRTEDACVFYEGDFLHTLLFAVEAYHETLALLKPFFLNGFKEPPTAPVSNSRQAYLSISVGVALHELNRFSDSREALKISLSMYLAEGDMPSVAAVLNNLAESLSADRRLAASFAVAELLLEAVEPVRNSTQSATAQLALMNVCSPAGLFDRAEAAYRTFLTFPTPETGGLYRPGEAEIALCWLKFYRGTLTNKDLDTAEGLARSVSRKTLRQVSQLRGELALLRGDAPAAVGEFERAIEMTHRIGLRVDRLEARLALARARAGEREGARETCERLDELPQPPHMELAAAYLELGDAEKARRHALQGYRQAWADGPPYALWWELEQCRAVLRALGEPEPKLPPFDPATVEPVPYEAEIRKLIAAAAEERERESS